MIKVLWKLWRIYAHLVGIIFMVFTLYYVIRFSIIYQPLNVNSDKATKVEIICTNIVEGKRYKVEITDQTMLKELISKTNSLKVTEGSLSDKDDYNINISFKSEMEYNYSIRLHGNAIIYGEKAYKVREKEREDYIEYIKYLIKESDNCIVEDW